MEFCPVIKPLEQQRLADLATEIWLEHFTPIIGRAQVEYMLEHYHSLTIISEQIAAQDYAYYLLEEQGQAQGYVGVQPKDGALFLSKLYIHRAARGKGLGKQAMAFVKDFAKQRDLSEIKLTVNRDNHASIAAYLKLGFVKTGEQCADIGGGYVMDDWLMSLRL